MQALDKQTIKTLLQNRFKEDSFNSLKDLPHPFLLKDCQKAARIIKDALQKNQKILLVGDYDADGTLGVVIVMSFFEIIGYKNISYYIPNRFNDGYGVNRHIIEQNPSDVVITIDNGITAFEVGEYCANNKIKLIITDHHIPQENLPLADSLINPQQKDCTFLQKEICGASVAWYLCNAIKIELDLKLSLQALLKYVAIATIADVMPLTHINKIFVKKGLEILNTSTHQEDLLLKSLVKSQRINAQDISFYIAPLLNSAGRIAEARFVCEFFLTKQIQKKQEIFHQLLAFNDKRKSLVSQTLLECEALLQEAKCCVLAYKEDWHEGIVGIVAARLVDLYQKPAFVFSLKDGILKGSGRSDGKIDIFQTLLPYKDVFLSFGGHSGAVGMRIEKHKIPLLLEIFSKDCQKSTKANDDGILGILRLEDIDKELLDLLECFEPYGEGNPLPHFLSKSLVIKESRIIKQVHQKLNFGNNISGIHFFAKAFFEKNENVDICFSLQEEDNAPFLLIKAIKCHS